MLKPRAIGPAANTVDNNIGMSEMTISGAESLKKLTGPRKITVCGRFFESETGVQFGCLSLFMMEY